MGKKARKIRKSEFKRLWASCKTYREKLIIGLLGFFGLRASEVSRIRKKDVKEERIFVRSGKGSNKRSFKIPGKLMPFVKRFTLETGGAYLVPSQKGGALKPKSIWRIVKRIGERARVKDVSTHSFRKMYIDEIYKKTGKNVFETSLYSRHKSIQSLVYYIEDIGDKHQFDI